jgi:hypothetical protein
MNNGDSKNAFAQSISGTGKAAPLLKTAFQ